MFQDAEVLAKRWKKGYVRWEWEIPVRMTGIENWGNRKHSDRFGTASKAFEDQKLP